MNRLRFRMWKSTVRQSFWRRISKFAMRRAYPWFDFSFFFMHLHDWFDYALKEYEKKGICINSNRISKQMKIASEICHRLSSGFIEDNSYMVVFGKEYTPDFKSFTDKERILYRRLGKVERRTYNFYLEYLTDIIRKNSLTWWD